MVTGVMRAAMLFIAMLTALELLGVRYYDMDRDAAAYSSADSPFFLKMKIIL